MLFRNIEKMNLRRLSKYISTNLKRGFAGEEIKKVLLSADWPEIMVDNQMSIINNVLKDKKKMEGRIMPKKISEEQARSFLRQLEPEKSFWVNNGAVLKNLEEFSSELKSMGPEQFSHHVNSEKNDFANWVNEVIGDQVLAKSLARIKTQKTIARTVGKRVAYLKRIV